MKTINLLLCLLAATWASSFAQRPCWARVKAMEEDTLSDIYAKGTVSTQWVAGSHYLAYSQRGNYFIVDANTGRQEPLVANVEAFAKDVATLTGDTAVRAGDLRVYGLSMRGGNPRNIYWTHRGKHLVYDRVAHALAIDSAWIDSDRRRARHWGDSRATTADSLFTMLGDAHNLYVRDNRTG